jgi:hypothetical protein
MKSGVLTLVLLTLAVQTEAASDPSRAPQKFRQEVAQSFTATNGLPSADVQLIECPSNRTARAFIGGQWHEFNQAHWRINDHLTPATSNEFAFADVNGNRAVVPVPWRDVKQVLRFGSTSVIATAEKLLEVVAGKATELGWQQGRVHQVAISPEGTLHVASADGLFKRRGEKWERLEIADNGGRLWAARDVLGVAFGKDAQLWFATRAGVGCRTNEQWRFFEGRDGLPWNDFTGVTVAPGGDVWFSTKMGAIRYDGQEWHYRQGPRWLPHDKVTQIAADEERAWFATPAGIGQISRRTMTLAEKAELYEQEIERHVKRTPFGFVAEATLTRPGDKLSAMPDDSDNDGLWTAMYGAGECFAFGATKDKRARDRARKAFEALRFLQKVTQDCKPAPPKGFVARTIRSVELPDPNVGRVEQDRHAQQHNDKLWKVYEPRWPKSADGKWFWKSDTSSDELDGHYLFYPLYYDLCADTDSERDRVREVVRDLTDHLIAHNYTLVDHDGRPARWGIFGPQDLNHDPNWWPERGLNSLSLLSYLAVAAHVTDDPKYAAASRDLVERHGYAQNLMFPKMQQGPGSGNQSDDEMAFMSYYSLLRYSKDEKLKAMVRYSFFRYWGNEAAEMNPFFNFAFATHNLGTTGSDPWDTFSMGPWPGWHEDSMRTLYGFPLDRVNWPHRNSHRLDIVKLERVHARDFDSPDNAKRGYRVNGKVLPVENRHFNHWNTDPWQLDYGGNGRELAAGTVFLLPYYMGLYHGFIELPSR